MRGGTNSKVKVKGSCLKPSKNTPGINLTRPSMRRQGRAQDTKVTVISQDQMDSLKSETNTPLVKHKQSYQEVLTGGDWGPGLSCPVWSTTSTTFFKDPNDKQEYKPPQQVASVHSANQAIESASKHGIQLVHGRANPGLGNCAIESVLFNIADRKEFTDNQKVLLHPKEARPLWVCELQTIIETDYSDLIPDNINNGNTEELWDKLKQDGAYEIELMGDLMLNAISRGCRKRLLIFNTSTQAADPIYIVEPGRFGGELDSEVPVCLAYNQVHYESLHPVTQIDVERTQALVQQYLGGTYQYGKKDIEFLITPGTGTSTTGKKGMLKVNLHNQR